MWQQLILIVEDEPSIRDMVRYTVERADDPATFTVIEAANTREADLAITKQTPDLILLDWMLPEVSGIKYTRQLKSNDMTRQIPIILLTAKAEEDHKVKGLETGADDYITKPFSPRELIARIKAVLRRGSSISTDGNITVGPITLQTEQRTLLINNEEKALTPIEFKLIQFLLVNKGRTFSREHLLNNVWGGEHYIDERTVDVQMLRLRKLLKKQGVTDMIQTVYGMGYKLTETINEHG